MFFRQKLAIFHHTDNEGNIQSLDALAYRYDEE